MNFKSREANVSLVVYDKKYPVFLSTSKNAFRKKPPCVSCFYSVMFLI